MESQSCPCAVIPFTNCQMHWHGLLLPIPVVIPEDNKRKVLATSLVNRLFFNRKWTDKRWQESYIQLHVSAKFPRCIPYNYSCLSTKNGLMQRICTHCCLYFGSIKSNQNHSPSCRSKKSAKSSNEQSTQSMRKVGPQSIEPRRQKELLFAEVFLERE